MASIFLFISETNLSNWSLNLCACVSGVCWDQDSHLALFQQDPAWMKTLKNNDGFGFSI